jgi:ribosome-associated translation inhibitor RaiA
MNITIKATRHELADSERHLVSEKLGAVAKLLGGSADAATMNVEVAITSDGEKHGEGCRAEVNLSVDGKFYRAEASAPTMISAIEKVRRELEREVRSDRGRARKLWKRGRAAIKSMLRGD